MIRLLFKKIRNFFSTEVPADIAACEFECRDLDCPNQVFENCSRRLQTAEELKNLSATDPTKNSLDGS